MGIIVIDSSIGYDSRMPPIGILLTIIRSVAHSDIIPPWDKMVNGLGWIGPCADNEKSHHPKDIGLHRNK